MLGTACYRLRPGALNAPFGAGPQPAHLLASSSRRGDAFGGSSGCHRVGSSSGSPVPGRVADAGEQCRGAQPYRNGIFQGKVARGRLFSSNLLHATICTQSSAGDNVAPINLDAASRPGSEFLLQRVNLSSCFASAINQPELKISSVSRTVIWGREEVGKLRWRCCSWETHLGPATWAWARHHLWVSPAGRIKGTKLPWSGRT